jgi:hypothetical protein
MYEEEETHEYYDPKDDDADLQEVEDLLETYFTHIDSTFAELRVGRVWGPGGWFRV